MASYTLTLKTEDDYRILKKILKAFDGASISPIRSRKSHFETAMDEIKEGKIVGPFDSVDSLMKDLLS